MIRIAALFPGESAWKDISHLVVEHYFHLHTQIMNDDFMSVVDTASCELVYDRLATSQLMQAGVRDKILINVFDRDEQPLFTGYAAPSFKQKKKEVLTPLQLEIRDATWKLDEVIQEDLQFPQYIQSSGVTLRTVYEALLQHAGIDASRITADGLGSDITIRMVHIRKGEASYREILDTLLSDYGLVFSTDAAGRFFLYQWDTSEYTVSRTITDAFSVEKDFSFEKNDSDYDGVKVIWSYLHVLDDVRLYGANLPLSADGSRSGEVLEPGAYYPKEGNEIAVYQQYQTDWRDVAYQKKETRKRNRAISLISSESQRIEAVYDSGITVDESYDTHQAQVLFHNPSEEIKRIYAFEIWGRALYRSEERETLVPETSRKPKEIDSVYLFDTAHAEQLAKTHFHYLIFGHMQYQFTLYDHSHAPGDIITIKQDDPAIDTDMIILEKEWKDEVPGVRYRGIGVSAFGDMTSITTAYHLAKSGKGEPGEAALETRVVSSNGDIFRPHLLDTTLEVRVYRNGEDITHTFSDADFRWKRRSDDSFADEQWNSAHYSTGGKTLHVTDADVQRRATFFCDCIR